MISASDINVRIVAGIRRSTANLLHKGFFPSPTLASSDSLPHISCVRGSPLFRTFLILVVIAASGFLFVRLTAAPKLEVVEHVPELKPNQPIEVIEGRIYVTLSGAARTVDLFANAGYYRFASTGLGTHLAEMKIAKGNPVLEIRIDWLEETTANRFAKVVVEAPGFETFTHVFDAEGDIDDFVELPF